MNKCRNCGAVNLRELGFIGNLAPFFLKRVLQIELRTRVSRRPLMRLIQRLTAFAVPVVSRIHPTVAAVELQSCLNCSFIQTKFPFTEEGIGRLYSDYRSDFYNTERCHYEPSYAAIAAEVGQYSTDVFVGVHEHINNYSLLSMQKLIAAAGLEIVFIEAIPVVSPVAKQDYIRALAKRPASS